VSVLSLIWGILAILGMFTAGLPCLGSINWINIPFSIIGLIIGIVAAAKKREGRGGAIAGIVLCAIAVVFGFVRLVAGGGVL
jgi:hypothetical protein